MAHGDKVPGPCGVLGSMSASTNLDVIHWGGTWPGRWAVQVSNIFCCCHEGPRNKVRHLDVHFQHGAEMAGQSGTVL
jgi:hypothetical protein